MKIELSNCLKKLKLMEINKHYEEYNKMNIREGLSFEDFLIELLHIEIDIRYNRKVQRLLKESKIDLSKTLENFDINVLSNKLKSQVNVLLDGKFIDRKENLLVFGGVGAGKTHIVQAICLELIHKHYKILFKSCNLFVQELLISKKDLRLAKFFKQLSKYHAIIIDDIGYVQQSREEMELLFTFFGNCYERTSLIITSNLVFSDWEKIFKDPMTTSAAIDRLIHHSVILEMNIPSYRLKSAKNRLTKSSLKEDPEK